jgi:hypothetical protein
MFVHASENMLTAHQPTIYHNIAEGALDAEGLM